MVVTGLRPPVGAVLVVGLLVLGQAESSAVAAPTSGGGTGTQGWALSKCWSSDNGFPDLLGISVFPVRVDVTEKPQDVTVVVDAVDTGGPGAATGIKRISVSAETDSRGAVGGYGTELSRQPDGTWRGLFRALPGERGRFAIDEVELEDGAGLSQLFESELLQQLGFAPNFVVAGPRDRQAPRLQALHPAARSLDVRGKPGTVGFRARAGDDRGVSSVLVWASPPGGSGNRVKASLARRTGTGRAGRWAGGLTLRPGVPPGVWSLRATVIDNVNRRTVLSTAELAAAGWPSTLRVRSRSDVAAPRLELLSVSPTLLDTRTGDGTVVIRVRGTDEGTGIQRMQMMLGVPYQDDELRGLNPIGRARLSRVGGDRRDGVWEARLTVSSCQPRYLEGFLQDQVDLELRGKDRTGHDRRRVFRDVLDLRPPDNARPRSFVTDHKAPAAGPITVYFENAVTGLRSPAVYPFMEEFLYIPLPAAPVSGTWTCTDPQHQVVSCADGVFVSATFTPAMPLQPGTRYRFVPNPEHTLDLIDLAGNPGLGVDFTAY
jgi:hypothetical protein